MSLTGFVSRRRRSLLTLLGILVAGGLAAAFLMPVGLFPNVLFPRVAVTIDAGDRPPDQMEIVITRPVEEAVRAIPGVQNLRSTTSRGSAEMSINFAWGSTWTWRCSGWRPRCPAPGRPCPQGSHSMSAAWTRRRFRSLPTA
jgi:multidrug efflux pump subunit AcrB